MSYLRSGATGKSTPSTSGRWRVLPPEAYRDRNGKGFFSGSQISILSSGTAKTIYPCSYGPEYIQPGESSVVLPPSVVHPPTPWMCRPPVRYCALQQSIYVWSRSLAKVAPNFISTLFRHHEETYDCFVSPYVCSWSTAPLDLDRLPVRLGWDTNSGCAIGRIYPLDSSNQSIQREQFQALRASP